jgi:hypothetical protein
LKEKIREGDREKENVKICRVSSLGMLGEAWKDRGGKIEEGSEERRKRGKTVYEREREREKECFGVPGKQFGHAG